MTDYIVPTIIVLVGLAILAHALIRIAESKISDTAKVLWVIAIFLIPPFGLLLTYVYVEDIDWSDEADSATQN